MEYIQSNKQLVIKLIENNNKSHQSPPINTDISLNTIDLYKFVKKAIMNKKFTEPYIIELQLKTILRCVWRTRWNKVEHPNYKYINNIATFTKMYANDADEVKPFIPKKTIRISKGCRTINQEDFTILQYCLLPSIKHTQLNDDLWNRYIFMLQNLLLATNIDARKQLKDLKIDRLKMADTDEERQLINEEYLREVDNTKNENTFKLINYINYLYYNTDCSKELLWRFVLMRWSDIGDNELDNYLDETVVHNEDDYRVFVNNVFVSNPTDIDLLKFYIAVNIYNYQFVHKSVIIYITTYVKLMLNYLVGHQQPLQTWKQKQLTDITNTFKTYSIIQPLDMMLPEIINTHLQKYNIAKTNMIIECINNNFPKELIDKYDVVNITSKLVLESKIVQLYNKYAQSNYESIDKELSQYDINILETVFVNKFVDVIGKYTPFITRFLKQQDPLFKDKLFTILFKRMHEDNGLNKHNLSIYACFTILMNDDRYYEELQTLSTNINQIVDFIIGTEDYIQYMNNITRNNYRMIALDLYESNKESITGFRKYKMMDIIDKLE